MSAPANAFEAVFDAHPQPMWVWEELSLSFLAANEAALVLYGYERTDFLGLSADAIRPPEDLEHFYAFLAELAEHPEVIPAHLHRRTMRHLHREGGILEVETSFTRLLWGGRRAVLGVVADLTAGRRAEELAREQANLLDLASDAIMVCSLDGAITFWNHGAQRLYGWTSDEAVGGDMVDMLMDDPTVLAATELGVREQGEWSGPLQQHARDGRELIVNSRWTLVRDDEGEPRSVLVINTDLTETKKLETQFLRAQRLESIGTLASGIAHDLNNILSPILMSVGLLRRSMVTADQERMLSMVEASAERGAGIVKQVLTFARGVEGERVLLQPKHLLSEMAKILAQTFPRNIDLQTALPTELWTVMGDATQLHQVLLNLCVNARDALPDGGVLTLSAENVAVDAHFARMNPGAQLGDHVALRITDTGTGIPPEVIDKIFDPFFTTKEVGKGTGLGLATVIGIVKSHMGFLTVQSEKNVGTTFNIMIPATHSEGALKKVEVEQVIGRGNGEVILVVDDEPPIREALVQTLADHGYRAFTAEDGTDALALYFDRREEIKVVLTDLAMAQMDGVALVRALRRFDAKVPVIVSTGHCQPEQTTILESLGVRAFLDKPYNAQKLLRAVHDVLQGAGQ